VEGLAPRVPCICTGNGRPDAKGNAGVKATQGRSPSCKSPAGLLRYVAGLCFFILAATTMVPLCAEASRIGDRLTAFTSYYPSNPDPSTRQLAAEFSAKYAAWFSPDQTESNLKRLNDSDVTALFSAASTTLFYTCDPRYVRDMRLDFIELQKRRKLTDDQYYEMYKALVAGRMFSAANNLARVHPSPLIRPLPAIVQENSRKPGPAVLVVTSDSRKVVRRSIDMASGARVIVVSSPLCHFCMRATRDIEQDPALRSVMGKYATWLVRPDGDIRFDQVRDWNRKHPREAMVLAYAIADWPQLDRWETPTFYVLQGRNVVAELVGWPRDGRKIELKAALQKVGLL